MGSAPTTIAQNASATLLARLGRSLALPNLALPNLALPNLALPNTEH